MIEAFEILFTWPYAIFLIRLLPTFIIFRWNLLGSLLFLILDASDYGIITANTTNFDVATYQTLDKIFDQYYLTVQLIIIIKYWKDNVFSKTGIFLYVYRLVGIIIFAITGLRWLLIVFPNIFEYYFDLVLLVKGLAKKIKEPKKISYLILSFLIPVKIYQELYLHSDLKLPIIMDKNLQVLLCIISLILIIYIEFFNKGVKKYEK